MTLEVLAKIPRLVRTEQEVREDKHVGSCIPGCFAKWSHALAMSRHQGDGR